MLVRVSHMLFFWLLTLAVPTLASDVWVEIGSARARVSEDTLTIFPKNDASYSKLRFQIANGNVVVHQARVYPVKGNVFHINLQTSIRANRHDQGSGDSAPSGVAARDYSRTVPLVVAQQTPIRKVKVFYKFKQQQTPEQPVTIALFGVPADSPTRRKSDDS